MTIISIPKYKLSKWGAVIIVVLIAIIIAVFQDYLESSIQSYQFYLTESLLFKVYWLLFIPFGFVLLKYQQSLIKKKKAIAFIALILSVIFGHLVLNGILVNLISKLLFDHQYAVLGVIFNSLSSHLYIYVLVYAVVIVAVFFTSSKSNVIENEAYINNILIEHGRKKTIITVQDIETIETEKPYVLINAGGEKYLYSSTLKTLATELNPEQFIRIHKSCIVNFQKVRTMKSRLNGDYDLTLNSGKEIRMSRNYAVSFKAKFENKSSS